MKKLTLALTAFLGLIVLTPTTAQAGCRTSVTVDRCGYTVYSEYRFVGRDCHGCPVYRWVVVRRVPPCNDGGHDDYSYGGHRGGRSHCGSGISIHWSR